jgi:hypothetical protein
MNPPSTEYNVMGILNRDTGHQGFSGSNIYSVLAVAQWIHSQRLSPENKGVSPYIPLRAGYRSKKQGLIHKVSCNSVGYFTPSDLWHSSHLDFLSFLFAMPPPLPLLHYQNTDLPVSFFLVLLPPSTLNGRHNFLSSCKWNSWLWEIYMSSETCDTHSFLNISQMGG